MITNNIGILIYSFLYGKKIGQDKSGNKFYVHKNNKIKKKWVLYNKIVDPTSLMVTWQLWLTNKKHEIPDALSSSRDYVWQKERMPNHSGTIDSYHPKLSKNKKIKNNKNKEIKEIWGPK